MRTERRNRGWFEQLPQRSLLVAWLIILSSAVQCIFWALDREPPFKLLSYTATAARAGDSLKLDSQVWRDETRKCRIDYTRYIYDSTKREAPLPSAPSVSAAQRDEFALNSPGWRRELVPIPEGLAPGPAVIRSTLNYYCNPLQEWWTWPIVVQTEYQLPILPP